MDWKLLATLGIEKESTLSEIFDALQEKKLSLVKMGKNEDDSEKENERTSLIEKIDKQLEIVEKKIDTSVQQSPIQKVMEKRQTFGHRKVSHFLKQSYFCCLRSRNIMQSLKKSK